MNSSSEIWRLVEPKRPGSFDLVDRFCETPELNREQSRFSAEHVAMPEAQGFRVTRNLASVPTAVMGEAHPCRDE